MRKNGIIMCLLIFVMSILFINAVCAENSDDYEIDSYEVDNMSSNIEEVTTDEKLGSDDCCEDSSTGNGDENDSKTWVVTPDPDNPNQVQKPTVQPVIDQAKSGDTIILNGTFIHCHFTVNKTLNIVAAPGTTLGICPHHNLPSGSSTYGVFYVTSNATGTVLDGFGFTNDFYHVGYGQYNPFAVLIDGTSDVVLKNIVVNWTGVKVDGNDKNPQDYIFNPILIRNADNTTLINLFINNTLNAISIENSSNTRILNSTIINSKSSDIFSGENNTNLSAFNLNPSKPQVSTQITADDLNVKAGDAFDLNIATENISDNQILSLFINGQSKSIQVKDNKAALSGFKINGIGTYYAVITYLGNGEYAPSQKIVKITVSKKSTAISASNAKIKVKKAKKIKITLKSQGKALSNKKVTINVNGKTFFAKTNSKGIANVKVKLTKRGTFKYTASFAGDGIYDKVSKTCKIKVK